MGCITRFDLQRIIEDFGTVVFFETGTWKGDAVAYALKFPFGKIYSVEIIPAVATRAGERFSDEQRVEIFEGSSYDILKERLGSIKENCLFWLDAHYPGADEGLVEYDAHEDEDLRLPLEKEIQLIRTLRKGFRDVIIIDDLRVYEDGNYEKGNAPVDTLPKKIRGIQFIDENFGQSHSFVRSYQDEGYLLLFPKKAYHKKAGHYIRT